jgi:hypothetical protein
MTQLPMFGQPPTEPEPKPVGDQVVRLQVLVTVKAAPNPSDKYGETVCVAGLSTDPVRPGWVRLYPINFRELGADAAFRKYDVVSVDAVPARQDSRRESWRPRMTTLQVENHLQEWRHRRPWLDPAISTDTTMCRLHRGATMDSPSLALIRPRLVTGLKIDRHPGWTPQQRAKIEQYVGQFDLFGNTDRSALEAPRYSGSYRYLCHDDACPGHQQGILDWEFVALQRHLHDHDDSATREALTQKFLAQMCGTDREIAFYVGNQAKRPRVFSVLGVYYPKRKR